MLIQVLRQSSWQNGRPTGGCQLTNATLCSHLGWSDSSHKTLLAELDRNYTAWFVTRERTRKRHVTEGHGVEGAPRYRVQMDDPLTPRDQNALKALLSRQRPATAHAAAETLATLARLRTRELWTALDALQAPESGEAPVTVAALAAATWAHLPPGQLQGYKPFAECAEQLQLRLTGVGYSHLELDYLLRGWLPVLGINNAWLIISLRARCFHDPQSGETRDVVVASRRELEKQINIPDRTFRRLLRDPITLALFHITPAGQAIDPLTPRSIPHRGDLAFHVAYPLLPVAPPDRAAYEHLLLSGSAALSTIADSASLYLATKPSSPAQSIHNRRKDPADTGQTTRLTENEPVEQPVSSRPSDPAETAPSGKTTRLEAASRPDIPNSFRIQRASTAKHPVFQQPLAGGRTEKDKSAIRRLLEPFGIQGIATILQNSTLTVEEVRGWIYRAESEVERSQLGGYLFRRLRVNSDLTLDDPLPLRYKLAGQVSPDEERCFERWWLEELTPPPFRDEEQRERFGAWLQVIKREEGDPDRPDYSPRARFRRELARS